MDKSLILAFVMIFYILMNSTIIEFLVSKYGDISLYILRENNNLLQNWNSHIILDVHFTDKVSCPYDYTLAFVGTSEEFIDNYNSNYICTKSGTHVAAIMKNKTNNNNDYLNLCYRRTKPNYPSSKTLYGWRGTNICIRTGQHYLDTTIVSPYQKCPLKLIKCPTPVDTLGNFMCVNHVYECGINYMEVINQNSITDSWKSDKVDSSRLKRMPFLNKYPPISKIYYLTQKSKETNTYNSRPSKEAKSLLIGRNIIGNYPAIAELKALQFNMCSFPTDRASHPRDSYIAYKSYKYANECKTVVNGDNFNPRYNKIDTWNVESFLYSFNGHNSYRSLKLFNFDSVHENNYNLYTSTFVGIHPECKQLISKYDIKKNLDNQNLVDILDKQSFVTSCNEILLGMMGFMIVCTICTGEDNKGCIGLLGFILGIMMILIFIGSIIQYSYFNSTVGSLYIYDTFVKNDLKCFDDHTENLIKLQYESLRSYKHFYMVLMIYSIINLIMYPCLYFLNKICEFHDFGLDLDL